MEALLTAITTYNVLSLTGERENEILETPKRSAIIGLQGTCRRSQSANEVNKCPATR